MVGFESLVQMIISTKQFVINKNHVIRSKVCIDLSETCLCLPITRSSMLGFINSVAQMIIMTRGCVANKNHDASSKFEVIDHT